MTDPTEPYYFVESPTGIRLHETSNHGVIAQDGNSVHETYLAWVAEGNTAPVIPVGQNPE